MVMLVRDVQPIKAFGPMVFTPSGMVTLVRSELFQKALYPIAVTL